jgi:hypothetical protein
MCRDTYSYVGRGLCLNGETTWERNLEPILPRLRLHMYIKLLLRRFVFLHRKRTVLVCTSKRSSVQSTLIDFLMFRYKTTKYLIVASGCSSRLWVPGLVAAVRGTMIRDDQLWSVMISNDPWWSAMIRDDPRSSSKPKTQSKSWRNLHITATFISSTPETSLGLTRNDLEPRVCT